MVVGEFQKIPIYQETQKSLGYVLKTRPPPVIRWPGGCFADVYHWRNGIGPREQRPVTYNENFGTFETDPNQFGTHEMMEFCEMIGAKPWFNINMMTGSPSEMREWMEYCNRKEPTALSQERKTNGHEKPFEIEYWGIGNEVWDGGGKMTPQMYANEYRKFSSSCPSFGGGDQTFSMKCINKVFSDSMIIRNFRILSNPDSIINTGAKKLDKVSLQFRVNIFFSS